MSVQRFCARLGIPRNTWYYWPAAVVSGRAVRRWPAPVVDAIEEQAAETAHTYSAWGHRKIWGMLRADGVEVWQSSVKRALERRGLLLPVRYQAERRSMAKARKAVFATPPTRRNRIRQTDFSDFETTAGGCWHLSGVVDYVAKVCLACPVTGTQTARDVIDTIEAAIKEAERLVGHTMLEECVDTTTGEIVPLVIVSDNGPGYKADAFSRFIASHSYLAHVRTKVRSPQTKALVAHCTSG